MKIVALLFAACISANVFGQQVSDYSQIIVPEKFTDFKETNQYNLNRQLGAALTGKRYQVVSDLSQVTQPCSALSAEINDRSTIFKTKIELNFKDCNNKIISSVPATSALKDYEKGFQEALRSATSQIATSSPDSKVPPKNEAVSSTAQTVTVPVETPAARNVLYTFNSEQYQKVADNSGNFSLIRTKDGLPFARFFTTSKKGVYLVKLNTEQTTVAFDEGSRLIVDSPASSGKQVIKFDLKKQ